jgi:hypothetical protein
VKPLGRGPRQLIRTFRTTTGLLALLTLGTCAQAEPSPSPAAMCVAQAERAQEFYHAGDLAQARAEVALCAQAHCPDLVRNDCESWLHEWDRPTTSKRRAPAVSVRQTPPTTPATSTESLPPSVEDGTAETVPDYDQSSPALWPWFAAALGVAGGAGFAYWGINGRREAEELADTCGRTKSCRQLQVDPVRNKLIFADISLGVGLIACGAAILGFATSNNHSSDLERGDESKRTTLAQSSEPTFEFNGSSVTARFVF